MTHSKPVPRGNRWSGARRFAVQRRLANYRRFAVQRRRSSRSFWLIRIRAIVMGTTTITAPQARLLRKFARDGVMAPVDPAGILGSDG